MWLVAVTCCDFLWPWGTWCHSVPWPRIDLTSRVGVLPSLPQHAGLQGRLKHAQAHPVRTLWWVWCCWLQCALSQPPLKPGWVVPKPHLWEESHSLFPGKIQCAGNDYGWILHWPYAGKTCNLLVLWWQSHDLPGEDYGDITMHQEPATLGLMPANELEAYWRPGGVWGGRKVKTKQNRASVER